MCLVTTRVNSSISLFGERFMSMEEGSCLLANFNQFFIEASAVEADKFEIAMDREFTTVPQPVSLEETIKILNRPPAEREYLDLTMDAMNNLCSLYKTECKGMRIIFRKIIMPEEVSLQYLLGFREMFIAVCIQLYELLYYVGSSLKERIQFTGRIFGFRQSLANINIGPLIENNCSFSCVLNTKNGMKTRSFDTDKSFYFILFAISIDQHANLTGVEREELYLEQLRYLIDQMMSMNYVPSQMISSVLELKQKFDHQLMIENHNYYHFYNTYSNTVVAKYYGFQSYITGFGYDNAFFFNGTRRKIIEMVDRLANGFRVSYFVPDWLFCYTDVPDTANKEGSERVEDKILADKTASEEWLTKTILNRYTDEETV